MLHIAPRAQVFTPFGSGYIAEQHSDQIQRQLARPDDVNEMIGSLTAAMFAEIMKSLRSTLSLRQG